MRIARRYLITGRVQGVGFRYFAHDVASREGVNGWAKNLPDGRVEISAEGEHEAMERFERQIRHGPPAARVSHVEMDEGIPTGTDNGFSVR